MVGLKKIVAVGLAAASVAIPSAASAQYYNPQPPPPQYQSQDYYRQIEQVAADLHRDRIELQRALQTQNWERVRFERQQIAWREQRLHQMIGRCRI